MKLKKLHIENYKMFHDFDINFVDTNDKILPLIVLAGANGSGKTTLLEYIYKDYISITKYLLNKKNYIEAEYNNQLCLLNGKLLFKKRPTGLAGLVLDKEEFSRDNFSKNIIYIKAGIDDISLIEKEFQKSWYNFLKNHDYRPSEVGVKFNDYIKDIFNTFDLTFEYSRLDKDDNVLFKNKNNEEFKIEALSTGEKTLLSKILLLFFKEYKNKVILIDEPELSLHPEWQNKVLQVYVNFANKNNCQIIIATHSPHIIANTPHKYLKILSEQNNKIVVKSLHSSPLDSDLNTIVKTVMGANYIPDWLEDAHLKYRQFCENGEEDISEAKEIKNKILEYESTNSSFFQGLAFDMELME